MDRRTFFQTTSLAALGALIVPASLLKSRLEVEIDYRQRIIYVNRAVSEIETKELYDAVQAIWDHDKVYPFHDLMMHRPERAGHYGFTKTFDETPYPGEDLYIEGAEIDYRLWD
jgi:hypothetical protein